MTEYITGYILFVKGGGFMLAKIFENGKSQAVRIPKEFRFPADDNEVYISKIGDVVMLMPKKNKWKEFLAGIEMMPEDFMSDGREQEFQQEREFL